MFRIKIRGIPYAEILWVNAFWNKEKYHMNVIDVKKLISDLYLSIDSVLNDSLYYLYWIYLNCFCKN